MLPTKEDIFSELEFVFKFYRGRCDRGNRRVYVEETNSKMYGVDQDNHLYKSRYCYIVYVFIIYSYD